MESYRLDVENSGVNASDTIEKHEYSMIDDHATCSTSESGSPTKCISCSSTNESSDGGQEENKAPVYVKVADIQRRKRFRRCLVELNTRISKENSELDFSEYALVGAALAEE
jgi:hypothetical protein